MVETNIYLNHPLYDLFHKKVLQINNNDVFFSGNFISNKNIKIIFNEATFFWIKTYKYELSEIAAKIFKLKKYKLNFSKFLIVFYFYFWILEDLRMIANEINLDIKKILNIGAGIGLFDILINEGLKPKLHSLVEIKESDSQIDIDGSLNKFKEKIYPFTLLSNNLKDYSLKNIKINSPDALYVGEKFDLILSIRSWCFLYPLETYIDYIKKVSNEKTIFIADVHKNYIDSLPNFFTNIKLIKQFGIYNRLFFNIKK